MSVPRRRFYGAPMIPPPSDHEPRPEPSTRRRIIFAAIGSSSQVDPLEVDGTTNQEVAAEVLAYVRPILEGQGRAPNAILVTVDLAMGNGFVRCSSQPSGWFIIRPVST